MTIVTVGIGLAKNVFAVNGLGESGKAELMRPDVPCARLLERIAGLPLRLIGMETCSWAPTPGRNWSLTTTALP